MVGGWKPKEYSSVSESKDELGGGDETMLSIVGQGSEHVRVGGDKVGEHVEMWGSARRTCRYEDLSVWIQMPVSFRMYLLENGRFFLGRDEVGDIVKAGRQMRNAVGFERVHTAGISALFHPVESVGDSFS